MHNYILYGHVDLTNPPPTTHTHNHNAYVTVSSKIPCELYIQEGHLSAVHYFSCTIFVQFDCYTENIQH